MAAKHPYVSSTGVLAQVFDQLQKSFPSTFNAETLKKLGFAPNNESYIINVVRYLGLIDESDTRTVAAQKTFTLHDSETFKKAFGDLVSTAYDDLFALHHEAAWSLSDDKLIPFFRQSDQTSELVGSRQASTFRALASYAGHAPSVAPKATNKQKAAGPKPAKTVVKPKPADSKVDLGSGKQMQWLGKNGSGQGSAREVGLTVRIEINLPATGDQNTYDAIFKSIRENFLNV